MTDNEHLHRQISLNTHIYNKT